MPDFMKGLVSGIEKSKGTEIELGTVHSAEMGITLLTDMDRYTLEDHHVEIFEYTLSI